jgi:putative membrane protein
MRTSWNNKAAVIAAGMLIAFGSGAYAQNNANANAPSGSGSQMSAQDRKFAREAAQGGLAEVELGQLATQKGQNAQVKQFGQRMVDDHSKANDQLKSIASKNNIQLPTATDAKDQALKDKLNGMSGQQFDRAYIQSMVKDHQKDIAEFQKEASNGSNPDLKNFAAQTVPILQQHLQMAQQAEQTVVSSK